MGFLGCVHGVDELVDGGIAVGVGQHLPAVLPGAADQLDGPGMGEDRVAGVGRLLAFGHLVIRQAEPGGLALRRAVQGDVDPADAEVVGVVLAVMRALHGRAGQRTSMLG